MVDDVLQQDPDLEASRFEILDFSAPAPKKPRTLHVTDARDVPRVSAEEKVEMLSIFAEGYFLAQAELAGGAESPTKAEEKEETARDDQPGLFDRS